MILIIGGMGFIGLNTALRFLEVGQRVVLSQHSARRIPDVPQTEIDVVALRIGSIYGPFYYSMHNPISRMCHGAARNTEPDFSDRPDGKIFEDDQADWTYVKDVARGIQQVHTADKLAHRVYNVASGRASSNRDAFEAVRKAVPGARCSALKPGKTPGGSTNPATDLTWAAEVGYRPEHTLETGIAAYIDWLRTNPQ